MKSNLKTWEIALLTAFLAAFMTTCSGGGGGGGGGNDGGGVVYEGIWQGTTSHGKNISFTIQNNVIKSVTVEYHFQGDYCDVEGSVTTDFAVSQPITGNSITITKTGSGPLALSYTVQGTFTSSTTASGTLDFAYTQSYPNPSCNGTASATWSAAKGNAADVTPPTVLATIPQNNATDVPVNAVLLATFSESVSGVSVTTFTLSDSDNNPVAGTVSYGGATATFTPSSPLAYSTTYTVTITTGVKDLAGNPMAANYSWTFITGAAVDSTPPTVNSTNPANNATAVAMNAIITATFSEPVSGVSLTTFTLKDSGDNPVAGSVTYTGSTAMFTPTAPLANSTTYTATITTGVTDLAGNAMAGNYTWSFTTTQAAIGTISIPGAQLTAMAVYESGNKVFVADNNIQSLAVIDGATSQITGTIPNLGGAVFEMVVNETYGKVYVASDVMCCTTGITPGTGLISIVSATTNQIIKQINPGQQINNSYFLLANDDVHDKIYVAFYSGVGVIDAATDSFTLIPGTDAPFQFIEKIAINTVTNDILIPQISSNRINIINGNTLGVQFFDLTPTGASQSLDIAVNETENKVYVSMNLPPVTGGTIFILDRDTGEYKFVGEGDLVPLAFNTVSNQLFTGVQIGINASIVDGVTDSLTYIDLGTAGIGAIAVRNSTDHAYLVNQQYTVIVDGSNNAVQLIPTNIPLSGGLVVERVVINQSTGRVYVINDDEAGTITVFQD